MSLSGSSAATLDKRLDNVEEASDGGLLQSSGSLLTVPARVNKPQHRLPTLSAGQDAFLCSAVSVAVVERLLKSDDAKQDAVVILLFEKTERGRRTVIENEYFMGFDTLMKRFYEHLFVHGRRRPQPSGSADSSQELRPQSEVNAAGAGVHHKSRELLLAPCAEREHGEGRAQSPRGRYAVNAGHSYGTAGPTHNTPVDRMGAAGSATAFQHPAHVSGCVTHTEGDCTTPHRQQTQQSESRATLAFLFLPNVENSAEFDLGNEAEWLLATCPPERTLLGVVRHHLLFFVFSAGILAPGMMQTSLFATLDPLSSAVSSVTERSVLMLCLFSLDAIAFCLFAPLLAFCHSEVRFGPHIMLLTSTGATVGSSLCALYGYHLGNISLFVSCQLLHPFGLAASAISLFVFACAKMTVRTGVLLFMPVVFHLWLLFNAVGSVVFSAMARRSKDGVSDALFVFFYTTCAGFFLSFGVCVLVPSAACRRATRILSSTMNFRNLIDGARGVDLSSFLRCVVCGLLFAAFLLSLLEPKLSLLSSASLTAVRLPYIAALFLFLVAFFTPPLCLVPQLVPFVRVGECGLSAAAIAVVLTTFSQPLPSSPLSPPPPFLATPRDVVVAVVVCSVSLSVAVAAFVRSFTLRRRGDVAAAPALSFAAAMFFAACLAFVLSCAAGVLMASLRLCESGDARNDACGAFAGKTRRVLRAARTVMCASAALLQMVVAALRVHIFLFF